MLTADMSPGFPIRRADAQQRQLGGRACQTRPPPGFQPGQLESTKATIEGLLAREDVVDNRAEFLGDQGPCDRFAFATNERQVRRCRHVVLLEK